MMTVVYGISNCDTVKKARVWLDERGVGFAFHDFKKPECRHREELAEGRAARDARQPPRHHLASANNEAGAIALMLDKPSVIKRPVVEVDGRLKAVGFVADQYAALFAA